MILPLLTQLMIKPNFYANCLAGPSKYTLTHTHTHIHTHACNLSILFYVDQKYMLLHFHRFFSEVFILEKLESGGK